MFVWIFSGIILDTIINKGDFLGISDGHFNNNNKFKKFKNYDELKIHKVDNYKYFVSHNNIIGVN